MAKLRQVGKMFPTLNQTVASYDPATFYIYLDEISAGDLVMIRKDPFTARNIEHIKTLFHEIRHSVDHIGTLWGQKSILQYLKAINARLGKNLADFNEIVKYKHQQNQLYYASYFAETYNYYPVDKIDRRWKWEATTGLKFDAHGQADSTKPIPFIQFATFDEKPLMRTPISIASLLETNSTAEEVKWHLAYIAQMSETERPFHLKLYEQETLLTLLYNQKLVVYNVAVHLASNVLGLADFTEAFQISSAVSTLALNLPQDMIKRLPIKDKKFEIWGERCQFMLNNNEYGFIYYLLLDNYAETYRQTKKFDISDVLKSSDLPEEKEIHAQVLTEMSVISSEAEKYLNLKEMFLSQLKKGRLFFDTLGICGQRAPIGQAIAKNTPTLICNDTPVDVKSYTDFELFSLAPIGNLSLSEWYNVSTVLSRKLTEFYEIRGV